MTLCHLVTLNFSLFSVNLLMLSRLLQARCQELIALVYSRLFYKQNQVEPTFESSFTQAIVTAII